MTDPARPDLDICACGDSRRDHPDDGACVLCRAFPAPWGGCVRFRFSHPASAVEVAEQERLDETLEEGARQERARHAINAMMREGW
jgi:hypothetical protein